MHAVARDLDGEADDQALRTHLEPVLELVAAVRDLAQHCAYDALAVVEQGGEAAAQALDAEAFGQRLYAACAERRGRQLSAQVAGALIRGA